MSDTAISPSNGSIVATGYAPLLKHTIPIAAAGSIAIGASAPTTVTFEPTVCTPGAGSIAVTSYAPKMDGWASLAASSTTWTNL